MLDALKTIAVSETFTSVHVKLHHSEYEIRIGPGLTAAVGEHLTQLITQHRPLRRVIVITDVNVEHLCARPITSVLKACGVNVDILVVPAGEKSKCLEEAQRLWNKLLELGTDRQTIVVAVGGGVVGDLAGFVAACYARGIAYVQVPTTLLAQVDSSVGGKVGVNLPQAKNMVGAFWQPAAVLIDIKTLDTLPEREYYSGLAEVVKYGVILDADFFSRLERDVAALISRQGVVLRDVITRCCRLKADIVEADEREETGHRTILNYGHTFAHALEAITGFGELLHGEAVSIGMMYAARLAQQLKRVDAEFVRRQELLLMSLNLPVTLPVIDIHEMLAVMMRDKKNDAGKLRFVLPTQLGNVELVNGIDSTAVRATLES